MMRIWTHYHSKGYTVRKLSLGRVSMPLQIVFLHLDVELNSNSKNCLSNGFYICWEIVRTSETLNIKHVANTIKKYFDSEGSFLS